MRWALIFDILLLACTHQVIKRPPKERWGELAMNNLWRQQSFSYHHRIDHRRPPFIKGHEEGIYMPDYAWIAEGEYQYGDRESPFSIITIGKLRYEKKDGQWEIGELDKEETIEARIKKVVSFGKFKMADGHYTFKPNLLYLDPLEKEKFRGVIEIDPDRLLPRSIVVTTVESLKVWEIYFDDFNRKRKVSPPIRESKRYIVEPADRDLIGKLKMRLNAFDIKARIDYELSQLIITTSDPITIDDLNSILSPGTGGLYGGHWQNNKFEIDSLIVDRDHVKETELGFDPLSRPVITIILKDKIQIRGHIGLFVDDQLIGTKYFDSSTNLDKIDFLMLSDFRKAERVAGKLSSPGLPKITIMEVEGK